MSNTQLVYDFRVIGLNNIRSALANVERQFVDHNRRVTRGSGPANVNGGAGRGGAGSSSTASLDRQRSRELWRQYQEQKAAEASLDRQRSRELSRRAGDERRIVREKQSAEAALDRQRSTALMRAHRERQTALAREAQHTLRARTRFAESTVGVAGRSVRGAIGGVGRFAAAGLGIIGGLSAGISIDKARTVERTAAEIAVKAHAVTGETRSREELQAAVTNQAKELGVKTGLGPQGILEALDKIIATTGNLNVGQQLMPAAANISLATGADIGDVGNTIGSVLQTLEVRGIKGAEAVKQVNEILQTMGAQAAVGSIEFKDLAQIMPELMASTAGFTGKVSDLTATMGAFAQLSKAGGAPTGPEAATAILRFRDALTAKAGTLKKTFGVNVFADKGNTIKRDPLDVALDILEKTGGDMTKVAPLFDVRAMKAFDPLVQMSASKGGWKEGLKFVRSKVTELSSARMSQEEIDKSAAFTLSQTGAQLDIVMADLNVKLGNELLPVVAQLIPEFAKMVPAIVDATKVVVQMVKLIADQPFTMIGSAIALKVGADIAAAGVGAKIREALVGQLSTGGPVGGTGIGTGGALSLAASGIAAFTITTAALTIMDAAINVEKQKLATAGNATMDEYYAKRNAIMGQGTPEEEAAALAKLRSDTQKELDRQMGERGVGATFFGTGSEGYRSATQTLKEEGRGSSLTDVNARRMMDVPVYDPTSFTPMEEGTPATETAAKDQRYVAAQAVVNELSGLADALKDVNSQINDFNVMSYEVNRSDSPAAPRPNS